MSRLLVAITVLCACSLPHATASLWDDLKDAFGDLSQNVQDALDALGLLDSGSSLPSAMLCPALGINQSYDSADATKCGALELAQKIITDFDSSKCDLPNYPIVPAVNVSNSGQPLPNALSDQRPLPDMLNKSHLFATEGATYYWFYRAISNFEAWAPCYLPPAPPPPSTPPMAPPLPPGTSPSPSPFPDNVTEPVPYGWELLNTTYIDEGDSGIKPLAMILRNASALVVLIRGTQSEYEWNVDFNYSMVNDTRLPGLTHGGFTFLANYIMDEGNLRGQVYEHAIKGNASAVIVAGHSLGAGVSTILSYLVQVELEEYGVADLGNTNSMSSANSTSSVAGSSASSNSTGGMNSSSDGGCGPSGGNGTNSTNSTGGTNCTKSGVRVHALLYAPPSAGGGPFAAKFNDRINARAFKFAYDPVPQVPCQPQIACDNHDQGEWPYVDVGGVINITGSDMPLQPELWANFSRLELSKSSPFMLATHTCSYMCSLSQFVNDTYNQCLLHTNATAVNQSLGTYCGGHSEYPLNPEYP